MSGLGHELCVHTFSRIMNEYLCYKFVLYFYLYVTAYEWVCMWYVNRNGFNFRIHDILVTRTALDRSSSVYLVRIGL